MKQEDIAICRRHGRVEPPPIKGLRKLAMICERFAAECSIIYNMHKTECMLFNSPSFKMVVDPTVFVTLLDENLIMEQCFKYLGYILVFSFPDDLDIGCQYLGLCARANMFKR